MNKAELVAALEGRLGSKKIAADALEAVVDTITRTVAKGERVVISGFGSFEKTMRGARVGRNPRTGEKVKIKKTSVPRFKPGTAFKSYVSDPKALPKPVAGAAVTARQSTRAAAPAKAAAAKAAPAKAAAVKAAAVKAAPVRTVAKAPVRKVAAKAPVKAAAKTVAKAPVRKVAAKAPVKAASRPRVATTVKKVAAKAPARRPVAKA